jgi:FKBP-type peptidyl-prolyl cis-trans isomerase 2
MKTEGDKQTTIILVCLFVIVAAAILIISVRLMGKGIAPTTAATTTQPQDASNIATTTRPSNLPAAQGDVVELDYTGTYPNGSIFDTSIKDTAVAAGIYSQTRNYQPIVFTIGLGEVIPGIENETIGMKPGDRKTVFVTPENGYGEWSADNVDTIPLVQNTSRIENVTLELFKNVTGQTPTEGATMKLPQMRWPITILKIENGTVFMQHNPENGTIVPTSFGNSSLTVIDDRIYARLEVVPGEQITTSTGYARIINVTEENVTIDANHELAGKNVTFDITLISVNQKQDTYAQQMMALQQAMYQPDTGQPV